jgi:hypothetical protein
MIWRSGKLSGVGGKIGRDKGKNSGTRDERDDQWTGEEGPDDEEAEQCDAARKRRKWSERVEEKG